MEVTRLMEEIKTKIEAIKENIANENEELKELSKKLKKLEKIEKSIAEIFDGTIQQEMDIDNV